MLTNKKTNAEKAAEAVSLKALSLQDAENGRYINASFHAAKALKLFGEVGDKKNIKELKRLVVEYNQNADLKEHRFSVPFEPEVVSELEKMLNEFSKESSLAQNLILIAGSKDLVPSFKHAVKNAKEIVPVTAQLVTHLEMDKSGHLISLDDFGTGWLATHYGIQMNLCLGFIDSVFIDLRKKGQLNRKSIMDEVLLPKSIFSSDVLLKFDAIFERSEEGDYLSAIHILVPLFEKVFMDFSQLLELDTIAYIGKTTSTRGSTLSTDILKSKEYQQVGRRFLSDDKLFPF